MIKDYFISALQYISKKEVVPYYIDSKIRDLAPILSVEDIGFIIMVLLNIDNPVDGIRYFSKNKVLNTIFPFLDNLKSVPQDKGKTKNAYEHTLNVLSLIPSDDIMLRIVALLHDSGKYDSYRIHKNFYSHADFSSKFAEVFMLLYEMPYKDRVIKIIKYHMKPLDYQRQPNWTDKAIIRFINSVGREYVLDLIDFSYYDKKAENDVEEYLQIIKDFRERVIKLL